MPQKGLWAEVNTCRFIQLQGIRTGGPVNGTTARVRGSPGGGMSQRGWADGVLNESALRQVDGCHPHFATASKQVASSSPHGHLHQAPPPPGSRLVIYTPYARTPVLTHRYVHIKGVHSARCSVRPAPGGWARKQPGSRLNPGVSFP